MHPPHHRLSIWRPRRDRARLADRWRIGCRRRVGRLCQMLRSWAPSYARDGCTSEEVCVHDQYEHSRQAHMDDRAGCSPPFACHSLFSLSSASLTEVVSYLVSGICAQTGKIPRFRRGGCHSRATGLRPSSGTTRQGPPTPTSWLRAR